MIFFFFFYNSIPLLKDRAACNDVCRHLSQMESGKARFCAPRLIRQGVYNINAGEKTVKHIQLDEQPHNRVRKDVRKMKHDYL